MPVEIPMSALPLKKALTDLYESAKGPVKTRFRNHVTDRNVKNVYEHLRDIGKVRTIWQAERPTSIRSFYYPQKLKIESETILIKKLSDVTAISNRIVIQGIVGQGKSIFMRYLCSEELKNLKLFQYFWSLGSSLVKRI